jgi:site-specific recombinase XerD
MNRLPLTAEQSRLAEQYLAAVLAAGMLNDAKVVQWPPRAFAARVGDPADWARLTLNAQCGLPVRLRHFVSWLLVTGRIPANPAQIADYIVAGRPFLGDVARSHHLALAEQFSTTAAQLGFARPTAVAQWSAVSKVAAVHRLRPDQLDSAVFHSGGRLLNDTARRLRPDSSLGDSVAKHLFGAEATLFHLGVLSAAPTRKRSSLSVTGQSRRDAQWAEVPQRLRVTLRGYLEQIAVTLRPATVVHAESVLREFAAFLAVGDPPVRAVADIRRCHIEAFKQHLAARPACRPSRSGDTGLSKQSIASHLGILRATFSRLLEWESDDRPAGVLVLGGDQPILDRPLPRFLDDPAAAKLLIAARADTDPFVRLCVEMLARTGLRKGEFIRLTIDAVVQIGSAFWLRVPVGKMHTDRYIPLHPQLKTLLDSHLADRPHVLRSELLFHDYGRPITGSKVDAAVTKAATAAGLGHINPHRLRHTLATQAINRGMSLEAIAALLGHKSLAMTMTYAKIADRTVAEGYFAVTDKVEALYDNGNPALPADAEGSQMLKLRKEMTQRMLGNGYCARPVEMDCHFESICESCTFFVTTIEFRPTLQKQRDDAAAKHQIGRQKVFDGLLERLDQDAS